MMIELSEEEFQSLLALVSIGERVMNDWTPEQQWSSEQRRSAQLLVDLCERAPSGRAAHLVAQEPDTGEWVPSRRLEDETDRVLGYYDEEIFWDQLVTRFARRDLLAEYGEEALSRLASGHRRQAEEAMIEYYEREVDRHGIARMIVAEEKRPAMGSQQWHNPPAASSEKV